ncbi:hypothetical protein [Methylobacterium oryzihabitans]|uniref:Uncharacterized protein n=1 Tax=Methylobacterium oryzihabitans TaxID=2499852 RepID=A0A437P6E4_9HYPH|nr:hypothetical protein [Methylobacterium oryzihabitans]RVU17839.1 hypothetical protein EOE48_13255 [Methylobacterium oryzihabitans]
MPAALPSRRLSHRHPALPRPTRPGAPPVRASDLILALLGLALLGGLALTAAATLIGRALGP